MKRFFYPLITLFIFFCSIHASADRIDNFNPKNYVYDDNGTPIFIKIYIDSPKVDRLHQNESSAPLFSLPGGDMQILNLMTQNDQRGSFIVIPIKKKKSKDDDD